MICWVRPGVLLVRASLLRPVMALIALDLPTLDLPANATSLPLSSYQSRGRWAAPRYSAWRSNFVSQGTVFTRYNRAVRFAGIAAGLGAV